MRRGKGFTRVSVPCVLLVSDWIREQAKTHRFIADGTFSPPLITMPVSGFILIIESILDEAHKKEVRKALVKAGAKDGSFTSVMGSALERKVSVPRVQIRLSAGQAKESSNPANARPSCF
jgi:hypothetical protein